jgi:hypothetical protein
MNAPTQVDPRALREQLSLGAEADVGSAEFLRFVVRLSEALDVDIPVEDYRRLTTEAGCFAWLEGR